MSSRTWGCLIPAALLPAFGVLALLWWWRYGGQREVTFAPAQPQDIRLKPLPATQARVENLQRVEGIGPKIASVLAGAGITTFAQLAQAEVSRLRQILEGAGIRLADPSTWPEQAALAAAGDWEGLKTLRGQLKGGRRA